MQRMQIVTFFFQPLKPHTKNCKIFCALYNDQYKTFFYFFFFCVANKCSVTFFFNTLTL